MQSEESQLLLAVRLFVPVPLHLRLQGCHSPFNRSEELSSHPFHHLKELLVILNRLANDTIEQVDRRCEINGKLNQAVFVVVADDELFFLDLAERLENVGVVDGAEGE